MLDLFYQRPKRVRRTAGPLENDYQRHVERTKSRNNAIPPGLEFDEILNNEVLPPCSLQDFMDYLVYIAHDAEILQFYLWLKDYTTRFNALRYEQQALSPAWNQPLPPVGPRPPKVIVTDPDSDHNTSLREIEAATNVEDIFPDPPASPTMTKDYELFITRSISSQRTIAEITEDTNSQAGLKWQPFTGQPFRSEIVKIIAHYFAPGAPRELNLSHRDKVAVLHALQHTTHPSAFAIIHELLDTALRERLHPNFIRWSLSNANKPKLLLMRSIGIFHMCLGILISIIMTLSSISRWYRIMPAPITTIGAILTIAASRGLCVLLHARGRVRNVKPWEDLDSIYSSTSYARSTDEESVLALSDTPSAKKAMKTKVAKQSVTALRPRSFDTFGPSNRYLDEPWVGKYEKRSWKDRIFEKNTWVQDDSVRLLQGKLILQSYVLGLVLTIVVHAAFVALPQGRLF